MAPLVTAVGFALAVFYAEAGSALGEGSSFLAPTKIAGILVMAVGVLLMLTGPVMRPVSQPMRWWWALVAWQALCALFAAYPDLSLLRVVQTAIPMVVAFTLVRRGHNPMWLIWSLLGACTAHVVYTLVNGTYVGREGGQRLVGLLIANTFALTASLVVVIAIGLWQTGVLPKVVRWLPIPLVVAAGFGVYLTVGRTASLAIPIALVAGAILFGRRGGGKIPGQRVILVLVLLGCLAYIGTRLDEVELWFATGNENLDTLTGRTTIWHAIWFDIVPNSPIVGYGPGAMRFASPGLASALGPLLALASAHSSFFETLLNTGYFGALLWVVAMVVTFLDAVRMRGRTRPMATSLFVLLAVVSLTVPSLAGFGIGWYALVATVSLVSGEAPLRVRAPRKPGRRGQFG